MNLLARAILPGLIGLAICLMWNTSLWNSAVFQVWGFALAAAFLLAWGFAGRPLIFRQALAPLSLMAIWPLLQIRTGQTVYAWRTSQAALYWLTCLAWYFIAIQLLRDSRRTARFLRALVFFAYAVALLAPLQKFTAPDRIFWVFPLQPAGSAMGPFVYANQFAGFVELLLPIAIYAAATDTRYRRIHIIGCAFLYTSVIAAASRAGFAVSTAVAIVTVVLLYRRSVAQRTHLTRVLIRISVIAAILIAAIGPATLIRKFTATDPYSVRREYLRSTIAMIRDRPLAGVGLGNWATVYPAYARFDDGSRALHARNDWAQWAAEGGLPFLAFVVWFAVGVLPRVHRTIWGYGVAAILLHCWVDFLIDGTAMAMLFFSVAGAVVATTSPPDWD